MSGSIIHGRPHCGLRSAVASPSVARVFVAGIEHSKWCLAFYALVLFFISAFHGHGVRRLPRAQDFIPYRVFTVRITLLVAATVRLSHCWFRSFRLIFTLHLTCSPRHSAERRNWGSREVMRERRGGVASQMHQALSQSQPLVLAIRAASTRLPAPSLLMASER